MLIQLTQAILDRLKEHGLDVQEIGFKDLIDGTINLTRPAVNITVNNAVAKKVTLTTYKWVCTVSLLCIINVVKGGSQGEGLRKQRAYELVEAVSDYLCLQDFADKLAPQGLALENPLFLNAFTNITTPTLAKAGYQVYEVKYWTSYNVTKEDPYANSLELKSLVAQYTIVPEDAAAEPPQAEDVITLN